MFPFISRCICQHYEYIIFWKRYVFNTGSKCWPCFAIFLWSTEISSQFNINYILDPLVIVGLIYLSETIQEGAIAFLRRQENIWSFFLLSKKHLHEFDNEAIKHSECGCFWGWLELNLPRELKSNISSSSAADVCGSKMFFPPQLLCLFSIIYIILYWIP